MHGLRKGHYNAGSVFNQLYYIPSSFHWLQLATPKVPQSENEKGLQLFRINSLLRAVPVEWRKKPQGQ